MSGPRRRVSAPAVSCALIFLFTCCLPTAPRAAPWAEPLPWDALTDDAGFTFEAQRFDDPDSGWQVDALGMMSVVPHGAVNRVYLRWRHLNFNTGGHSVLARWPETVPPYGEGGQPDLGWPGETAIAGWGRPELGLLAPLRLPLLGASAFCGEVALPFARNALYPFAARSTSLRLALRRPLRLGDHLTCAVVCEQVMNMAAAGEDLAEAAFPSLTAWGGSLEWSFARAGVLRLSARDAGGGASRRLRLTLNLPLGDRRSLALGVMRGLGDAEDRLFATRFTVAMSIGMAAPPVGEPGAAPEGGS
ncbi:hypothetical protein KKG45_13370 [bacterium]|nr:hypothetical protein [bacterium]MBU1074231.1 hypothetical protein [bacterium]MBU1675266.1 hypothetical protein [bacterium]